VWTTLFRSDLRYGAYSEAAATNSLGELVLMLLTEMVHRKCADPVVSLSDRLSTKQPSFVHENQSQIWGLPAFTSYRTISTTAPFELVCAVLQSVGLSEQGTDNIDTSAAPTLFSVESNRAVRSLGRRRRLLSLTVASLDSTMRKSNASDDDLSTVAVLSACIVALVHGKGVYCATTFGASFNRFLLTTLRLTQIGHQVCKNPQATFFNALWSFSSDMTSPLVSPVDTNKNHFDIVLAVASRSRAVLRSVELPCADFVSESESDSLLKCTLAYLTKRVKTYPDQLDHSMTADLAVIDDTESALSGDEDVTLPLYLRILAMKVSLAVSLCCREEKLKQEGEVAMVVVNAFLDQASTSIINVCDNPVEFLKVSTSLLRLSRSLVEISLSFPGINISWSFLTSLLDSCKQLLEGYAYNMRNGKVDLNAASQTKNEVRRQEVDDDMMGDDDDEEVTSKRPVAGRAEKHSMDASDSEDEIRNRRKGSFFDSQGGSRKRRKTLNSETPKVAAPDWSCAKRIASIILVLEPSVSNCGLVCGALLGTDLDLDPDSVEGDVDIRSGVHCVELLNDARVIFHHSAVSKIIDSFDMEDTDSSVIIMLCRVIELFRSGCADPSSPLYLYGYKSCAEVLSLAESSVRGTPITSNEAHNIIAILKEDSGIRRRPIMRADRLRAATIAFQAGGDLFHRLFDKDFANIFVKPSLFDTSAVVRKEASVAVGTALEHLDEKRMVESVMNLVPPITLSKNDDEVKSAFIKWYEKMGLVPSSDEAADNTMKIEDAVEPMQSSSIYFRSVISGCARSSNVFREALFGLIQVAVSRPELEVACFHALDKIAAMRDYSKVEDMIEHEFDWILKLWVDNDQSLFKIPLLVSAPKVLRRLLRAGQSHFLVSQSENAPDVEDSRILDIARVRHDAALHFCSKYRRFTAPLVLIRVMSTITEGPALKDKRLKEISSMLLGEGDGDKSVTMFLRCHIQDIQAFCVAMVQSVGKKYQRIGNLVLDLLKSALSEETLQALSAKKAHVTVRRILELSGRSENLIGTGFQSEISFNAAIEAFVEGLSRSKAPGSGDIFLRIGSSVTESLVHVIVWLNETSQTGQKKERWLSLEILCKSIASQIQKKDYDRLQFGFCIHSLLEVILNPTLVCLRTDALRTLKELLDKALISIDESELEVEVSAILQRLVGACFHVHEKAQGLLLSHCGRKAKELQHLLKRSLGLIGISRKPNGGDTWGWDGTTVAPNNDSPHASKLAIDEYGPSIDKDIRESIFDTYKILESIADASSLKLSPDTFLCTAPPYAIKSSDLDALAELDTRLCAQRLTQRFIDRMGHDWDEKRSDLRSLLVGLRERLSNRHSWMNSTLTRTTQINTEYLSSMNMDQRLLYAELLQLERTLRTLRSRSEDVNLLKAHDFERLVRELSRVCGASCPDELRFAASRCLGELSPTSIAHLSQCEREFETTEDWIGKAIENTNLIFTIQARIMVVLGDCLKSPKAKITQAAVSTLQTLSATEDGKKCWKLVEDPAAKRLLEPFFDREKVPRPALSLPENQLAMLRTKAGSDLHSQDDDSWCWNAKLWQCEARESTFEEWICHLVAALLTCCYKKEKNKTNPRGEGARGNFFRQCQMMSFLDHGFAAALFPCIVLDLLEESHNAGPRKSVRGDVRICQQLSESFAVLLGHSRVVDREDAKSVSAPDSTALALAVDTMDMLRRVTQHNFLTDGGHKRNISSLPDRSYETTKSGSRKLLLSQDLPAGTYNEGLPPPPTWRGVQYGIALQLDGLLVAKSCLQARRFASALFFTELYLNAELGSSGGIFEKLSSASGDQATLLCHRSAPDISGSARIDASNDSSDAASITGNALSAMAVIRKCLQELHEEEALEAIEVQGVALRFSQNDFCESGGYEERASSLPALQRLDTRSWLTEVSPAVPLQVTRCLDELGLRQLLQTYIEGLVSRSDLVLPDTAQQILKEKWFESSLRSMQWSNVSLSMESDTPEGQQGMRSSPSDPRIDYIPGSLARLEIARKQAGGFFESFALALNSFKHDDLESCRSLLVQGRRNLLNIVSSSGGEESSLAGMVSVIDQLRALSDMETISGGDTLEELVKKWGLTPQIEDGVRKVLRQSASHGSANLPAFQGFSSAVREIILGLFHQKSVDMHSLLLSRRCLIAHIWNVCSKSRQSGSVNVAEAALQRLLSILRIGGDAGSENSLATLDSILQVRLEEARILEIQGDFTGAIRRTKQTVDHLNRKKRTDGTLTPDMQCLLADALVMCGSWMTSYKVQQGKVVLDSYLQPAANYAMTIYDNDRSAENAERSTNASLALAQVVANLYDVLSNRVSSIEWKRAEAGIRVQEEDISRCEVLHEKAAKAVKQKQSIAKAKKASDEFNEIRIYLGTLRKDTERKNLERKNIEASVQAHLNLAIQSFTTALSLADTGCVGDMSRHVYRLISLWFSSCKNELVDDNVNALIAEASQQIPSFRFVPLTNQLFSRIDRLSETDDTKFQHALQGLIFKMCVDHPYHCIVQLIALSNGKNVGSGVSGHSASAFLENVGDSKIVASNKILDKLKGEAPDFIGKLVDSYRILTDAYIHLANAPTKDIQQTRTKNIPLSTVCSSARTDLHRCLGNQRKKIECPPCVLTALPPLRPDCNYGDGLEDPQGAERVAGFEEFFNITESGLHRPKIVTCIGTKGTKFRQLAKGEDEIRQDAVMSQVFSYVNELMARRGPVGRASKSSSVNGNGVISSKGINHRLKVVTYTIVPLSPSSGVSIPHVLHLIVGFIVQRSVADLFFRSWNG
jgi:hypothetical protein